MLFNKQLQSRYYTKTQPQIAQIAQLANVHQHQWCEMSS